MRFHVYKLQTLMLNKGLLLRTVQECRQSYTFIPPWCLPVLGGCRSVALAPVLEPVAHLGGGQPSRLRQLPLLARVRVGVCNQGFQFSPIFGNQGFQFFPDIWKSGFPIFSRYLEIRVSNFFRYLEIRVSHLSAHFEIMAFFLLTVFNSGR
jgi:hypothetical protein